MTIEVVSSKYFLPLCQIVTIITKNISREDKQDPTFHLGGEKVTFSFSGKETVTTGIPRSR